jgi:C-terminal processing protease CtpA/Prc
LYEVDYEGPGLKVAEIIKRGPCDSAACKIVPGNIITHINGVELTESVNPWQLLNRQVDKPVRLTLDGVDDKREEVIRPISGGAENGLLYERWIAGCRKRCDELSGGRIGYVHVRGMNDESFRRVYSEVLGKNNEKEALIVDTRFNGGGWLHEDLATFLDGELYVQFSPRGFEEGGLGGEPINKWTRPVAVLQSESNYSDAHFFPWAFREKGVGKLVGAPVPGTATAVWWEGQINPEIVFGIPQVGMLARDGRYLENNQLEPDVLVLNDPPAMAAGKDPQLEKAVELLLDELTKAGDK